MKKKGINLYVDDLTYWVWLFLLLKIVGPTVIKDNKK